MIRRSLKLFAILSLSVCAPAGMAQEAEPPESRDTGPEDEIIVTGQADREAVEALGKAITRPSRAGQPVARFDAPVCLKVSGLPADMAELVADRIRANIETVRGVEVAADGCSPNAFVGVLNNVNQTVDTLRETETWLFEGLLDYQVDRIYQGSNAVRAWHVFDLRNLDGSQIPGKQRGTSDEKSIASAVNTVEKASRISQLRNNLTGAVVLVETVALSEKTFRQFADYATVRILASTSDDMDTREGNLPTILTLFGSANPPAELTEFDRAYLSALYELPPNSRDGQVIAAAVSRYVEIVEGTPPG